MLLRGGDPRGVIRNKRFPAVVRKIQKMKERVRDMKSEREQEQKSDADRSATRRSEGAT